MNKDLKFIKRWERERSMGRFKYALINGGIFGFIICVINLLISYFSPNYEFKSDWFSILLQFGIYMSGSMFWFASCMWWMNEYLYKKQMKGTK